MLRSWSGTVIAFSMIEVMIYFSFILTMIILLIKARFQSIGVDNTEQFEETYLSYLLNEIITKLVK